MPGSAPTDQVFAKTKISEGKAMSKTPSKNPKNVVAKKAAPKKRAAKKSAAGAAPKHKIDPKMLGVLVCPKTRGPLIFDAEKNELISKKAKLAFPIRDGVPVLLETEARKLEA